MLASLWPSFEAERLTQTAQPRVLSCVLLLPLLLATFSNQTCASVSISESSGLELMEAVYKKHRQYPFVYEEQSMVLIDPAGRRETRKIKYYSRVEENLKQRLLLLFDSPEEVKGVAVLAERDPDGTTRQSIFLPALGEQMVENSGEIGDSNFLGTDFSVENLTGEQLDEYEYDRQRDVVINNKMYSVVDVYNEASRIEGQPLRRHYISQESMYLTRTDYFDDLGRVRKRQSHHDLTQVLGDMWRANMMLMENLQNEHQTLIKIDRRVFSKDYVPSEVFTMEYLLEYSQSSQEAPDTPDVEAEAELMGGER